MADMVVGDAEVRLRANTTEMSAGLQQAQKELGGFATGVQSNLGGLARYFELRTGFNLLRAGFRDIQGAAIGLNATLETSQLQFTTLTGDADESKKHVADLFQFAKVTPFETGPIIEASRLMQTFGGEALDNMTNLRLFGDAAAATGNSIKEVAFWVSRMYSEMQSGKPIGESARRLQEMAILSPQVRNELELMQKQGAGGAATFQAFTEDIGRFSGAMKAQEHTWAGLTSTMSDSIHLLIAGAFEPFFKQIEAGMLRLNTILGSDQMKAKVEEFTTAMTGMLDVAVTGFTQLLPLLKPVGESMPEMTVAMLAFFAAVQTGKMFSFINDLKTMNDVLKFSKGLLSNTVVQLGLVMAAVFALDQATRALTGQGLLQLFSDSDEKAKAATEAVNKYGDAVERVQALVKSGFTLPEAVKVETVATVDKLREAMQRLVTTTQAYNASVEEGQGQGKQDWFTRHAGEAIEKVTQALGTSDVGAKHDEMRQAAADVQHLTDSLIALAQAGKTPAGTQDMINELMTLMPELRKPIGDMPVELQGLGKSLYDLQTAMSDQGKTAESTAEKNLQMAIQMGSSAVTFDSLNRMAGNSTKGLLEFKKAEGDVETQSKAMKAAIQGLMAAFPDTSPEIERLKLQEMILKNLKDAHGGAFGPARQAELDAITAKLSDENGIIEILQQSMKAFAETAQHDLGDKAADAIKHVTDMLNDPNLTKERKIQIGLALPYVDMAHLLTFLDYLGRGFPVRIALEYSQPHTETIGPGGTAPGGMTVLPGLPGSSPVPVSKLTPEGQGALDYYDASEQAVKDLAAAMESGTGKSSDYTDATKAQGSAAKDAAGKTAELTQAEKDYQAALVDFLQGAITLKDAAILGLKADQVAQRELVVWEQKHRESMYQSAIQMEQLNELIGVNGLASQAGILQDALGNLGQEFIKDSETVTQFFARLAQAALDATQQSFDALFSKPTREEAQLSLHVAELERQRLLLIQGGAVASGTNIDPRIKALDKEIAQAKQIQELRAKDIEIMKLQQTLANATLETDKERTDQANLLTIATAVQSGLVKTLNERLGLEVFAHINTFNAANSAADALRTLESAALAAAGAVGPGIAPLPAGTAIVQQIAEQHGGTLPPEFYQYVGAPVPGAAVTGAVAAYNQAPGTALAGPAPAAGTSIQATSNVHLTPDVQSIVEDVVTIQEQKTRDAFRRAGFQSAYSRPGSFMPTSL